MDKQKLFIGLFAIILTASLVQITFDNEFKIRVYDDSTKYLSLIDSRWNAVAIETNNLFRGTTKLGKSNSNKETIFNYNPESNLTTITRTLTYINKGIDPVIIDTYLLYGNTTDITQVPISHTINILNGSGLIYEFLVTNLQYTGSTIKGIESPQEFGHGMKVSFQDGYYYSKIYKYFGVDKAKLIVRYRVTSDNVNYSTRTFDPPKEDWVKFIKVEAGILEDYTEYEITNTLSTDFRTTEKNKNNFNWKYIIDKGSINNEWFELCEYSIQDIPIYSYSTSDCDTEISISTKSVNKTVPKDQCTTKEIISYKSQEVCNYKKIDPTNYNFEQKKTYRLRHYITHDIAYSVNSRKIDGIIQFAGNDYSEYAWFNTTWNYKKNIQIQNTDRELNKYTIQFNISKESEMDDNYLDLRFTAENESYLYLSNIVSYDSNNAIVNVKITDTLSNSTNTSVVMYYGNTSAVANISDANADYWFSDFFDGTTLDTAKWSIDGTATYSIADGYITVTSNNNQYYIHALDAIDNFYYKIKTRMIMSASNNDNWFYTVLGNSTSTWIDGVVACRNGWCTQHEVHQGGSAWTEGPNPWSKTWIQEIYLNDTYSNVTIINEDLTSDNNIREGLSKQGTYINEASLRFGASKNSGGSTAKWDYISVERKLYNEPIYSIGNDNSGHIITNCTELNETGVTYYLANDITNINVTKCMSVTADDVTLDCQNNKIDGVDNETSYGVYSAAGISGPDSLIVQNCNIRDFNRGIYSVDSDNGMILNNTFYSNDIGLHAINENSFDVINNTFTIQTQYDILGYSWITGDVYGNSFFDVVNMANYVKVNIHNNIFYDDLYWHFTTGGVNIYNNTMFGSIDLINTNNYNIYSNTISSSYDALYLSYSSNGNIYNNDISNLFGDMFEFTLSNGITIYNNIINSDNYFDIVASSFNLNTTKQLGTNVLGDRNYIGGNYWTNNAGTGYSDTCDDIDYDGFCDSTYEAVSTYIDYLPYSDIYKSNLLSLDSLNDTRYYELGIEIAIQGREDTGQTMYFDIDYPGYGINITSWDYDSNYNFTPDLVQNEFNQTSIPFINKTIILSSADNLSWSMNEFDDITNAKFDIRGDDIAYNMSIDIDNNGINKLYPNAFVTSELNSFESNVLYNNESSIQLTIQPNSVATAYIRYPTDDVNITELSFNLTGLIYTIDDSSIIYTNSIQNYTILNVTNNMWNFELNITDTIVSGTSLRIPHYIEDNLDLLHPALIYNISENNNNQADIIVRGDIFEDNNELYINSTNSSEIVWDLDYDLHTGELYRFVMGKSVTWTNNNTNINLTLASSTLTPILTMNVTSINQEKNTLLNYTGVMSSNCILLHSGTGAAACSCSTLNLNNYIDYSDSTYGLNMGCNGVYILDDRGSRAIATLTYTLFDIQTIDTFKFEHKMGGRQYRFINFYAYNYNTSLFETIYSRSLSTGTQPNTVCSSFQDSDTYIDTSTNQTIIRMYDTNRDDEEYNQLYGPKFYYNRVAYNPQMTIQDTIAWYYDSRLNSDVSDNIFQYLNSNENTMTFSSDGYNGNMFVFFTPFWESVPSNITITIGDSEFEEYTNTTVFNTTELISINTFNSITNYIDRNCIDTYYCDVPFYFTSASIGIVTMDNITTKYNYPDGIVLDIDDVKYNNTLEIEFDNGIVQFENLNISYYGSDNISIRMHNDNYTINETHDAMVVFSNYSIDRVYDYVIFRINPTSINVTPYGQTNANPMINITPLAYDQPFNFSVTLNESIDDCINLTISSTQNKNDGFIIDDCVYPQVCNITTLDIQGTDDLPLYLWVDSYECNQSTSRWFAPVIGYTSCCEDCVACKYK